MATRVVSSRCNEGRERAIWALRKDAARAAGPSQTVGDVVSSRHRLLSSAQEWRTQPVAATRFVLGASAGTPKGASHSRSLSLQVDYTDGIIKRASLRKSQQQHSTITAEADFTSFVTGGFQLTGRLTMPRDSNSLLDLDNVRREVLSGLHGNGVVMGFRSRVVVPTRDLRRLRRN